MSINNLGFSCLHLCGPLLVRGPKFEKKRLRKLALPRPVYLLVLITANHFTQYSKWEILRNGTPVKNIGAFRG